MNVIECIDIPNGPHLDDGDTRASCAEGMTQSTDRLPRISLKQWRLFHAVVDNDGFVCAANKLHMSQSSISHALAKLQDQLGVPLLTIRGRKAHITEEGKALLERSRELVRQAVELEELGEVLRHGWEPEVRLAVEPNYPAALLMRTFRDLSRHARKVRLNVKEVSLTELRQSLHQDAVDLAISSAPLSGFASNKLIEIEHVAIAHADSPLFRMNRDVTFSDLSTYFEIVFCAGDHDATPPVSSGSVQGQRHWNVNSLDSAAEALQFGLGYAWLPRYRVQRWLDDGWARILPLNGGSSYTVQMHLIRGRAVAPGSGAQRFADALQAVADEHATRPGFMPPRGMPEAAAHFVHRC
jgi:DNA-binding transcriptional LysR family regulator